MYFCPTGNEVESWLNRIADFYILQYLDYQLQHSKVIVPGHTKFEEWVTNAHRTINYCLAQKLYSLIEEGAELQLLSYPLWDIEEFDPALAKSLKLVRSGFGSDSWAVTKRKLDTFLKRRRTNAVDLLSKIDTEGWGELVSSAQKLRGGDHSDILIDHVMDLEHRNGTIFNHLENYSPRIKRLLNAKASKPIEFFISSASFSVQSIYSIVSGSLKRYSDLNSLISGLDLLDLNS